MCVQSLVSCYCYIVYIRICKQKVGEGELKLLGVKPFPPPPPLETPVLLICLEIMIIILCCIKEEEEEDSCSKDIMQEILIFLKD